MNQEIIRNQELEKGEDNKNGKYFRLTYSSELYKQDPTKPHDGDDMGFQTDLQYLGETPGIKITKTQLNQDQNAWEVTIFCTSEFNQQYLDDLKIDGVEIEELEKN